MATIKLCNILIIALCLVVLGQAANPATISLSGIIRDQAPSGADSKPQSANNGNGFYNTDFEYKLGTDLGIVGTICNAQNGWKPPQCSAIGSDQTPVYAFPGASKQATVHGPGSFYTWFHDTNQTKTLNVSVVMSQQSDGSYKFRDDSYFPIDNKGWGDWSYGVSNAQHNFGFCLEMHSRFGYAGGEQFKFTGDDDVFVYLDGRLMLDLGGVHTALSGTIDVSLVPDLVVGKNYRFDFFYCERHTVESKLELSTSMLFYCSYNDWCNVCEGNGQSCCTKEIIATYCNDSDPCTIDKCHVTTAPYNRNCSHTTIICAQPPNACQNPDHTCTTDGTCVYTNRSCGVSNACTQWTCDPVLGCQKKTLNCNDGKACTNDTCDPTFGCRYTPISCDDGDACTTDTCSNTTGCSNVQKNCFQDNCHTSSCNPSTGCVNTLIPNCTLCVQGTCNTSDPCRPYVCNSLGICILQPVVCNDNNICTNDSCVVDNFGNATCLFASYQCPNSTCNPTTCNKKNGACEPVVLDCDDESQCTNDTVLCGPSGLYCNYTFNGLCDDKNVCTNDFCNGTALVGQNACSYSNITCPAPEVCEVFLGCDRVKGCSYTNITCPAAVDLCHISTCDPVAGCIIQNKVCVVDDVNCFEGECDPKTGACSKQRKGNFNTATSSNGISCLLRYDQKARIAIGAGAAAGIAIGAAAAIGILGYGGKKGYDMYQAHQNLKNAPVQDNPLYEATNQNSDNPLYRNSLPQ